MNTEELWEGSCLVWKVDGKKLVRPPPTHSESVRLRTRDFKAKMEYSDTF